MPMIQTKVNVPISAEQEITLKEKFADAITCFPGKTEAWLMLSFEDNCRMFFKGENNKPMAYLEVALLGTVDAGASSAMSGKICTALKEILSISPDCVYIRYIGAEHWGWNGSNF